MGTHSMLGGALFTDSLRASSLGMPYGSVEAEVELEAGSPSRQERSDRESVELQQSEVHNAKGNGRAAEESVDRKGSVMTATDTMMRRGTVAEDGDHFDDLVDDIVDDFMVDDEQSDTR